MIPAMSFSSFPPDSAFDDFDGIHLQLLRHLARLDQDLAIVVVIISIGHYEVLRFNGRSAPFNKCLRCGAPIDGGLHSW
jgi:hypothetical protein